MRIHTLPVGPFQMNAYVVYSDDLKNCLLFDPGDEIGRIKSFLEKEGLKPRAIFNTHAHIDHIRFLADIQKAYDLPLYLAEEELPLLNYLPKQGAMYGLETGAVPTVHHYLKEGQHYDFGELSFHTLHTPGHSPGSICFVFNDFVISGDVLFYNSIGRTDLYMGDMEQLLASIRNKLWPLDDALTVYPGHGPATTIGREKKYNPFLK